MSPEEREKWWSVPPEERGNRWFNATSEERERLRSLPREEFLEWWRPEQERIVKSLPTATPQGVNIASDFATPVC